MLQSASIILLETVRLAQLVGLPLLSVAQARRTADGPLRRRVVPGLAPQYRQHLPLPQQLQQQREEQQALAPAAALSPPGNVAAAAAHRTFTVVLDLDETLVCTWRADGPAGSRQGQAPQAAGAFDVDCEVATGTRGRLTVSAFPRNPLL